jgi:alpha-tubulin suppressor-like RCC1 family protein
MHTMPRFAARSMTLRLLPICAALAGAGCAFPTVGISSDPNELSMLPGGSGTVTVTTTPPRCRADEPLPCVDVSGRVFDYVVQNLPPGITYTIDTTLQSPSTPGVVRITFHVAAHVSPANHHVALIHAVLDGRSIGSRSLSLRVLSVDGTTPTSEPVAIAGGGSYTLAALADGSVRAWGENRYGELGIGNRSNRTVPIEVDNLDGIVAVAAGEDHSLALSANGLVWAWGRNNNGQLGNGTTSGVFGGETTPVQVQGVHNIQALAAGSQHSLALKTDGTVWAWGSNFRGKLGTGDTSDRNLPVQVERLPRARAIAAGSSFSLAVDVDGFVWIWGTSALGDEVGGVSLRPVQVAGLNRIQAVAARESSALALDQDGRIWAWGGNRGGELGDGTTLDRAIPVRIEGPEDVVSIALGSYHALALTAAGTVWAWGGNTVGQLGIGSVTDPRLTPDLVPGLTSVRAIAAGGNHALALLRCGQLWVWGQNLYGQLGDGTERTRYVPMSLPGLGDDRGCDTVSLRVALAGDVAAIENIVSANPGDLQWNGLEFVTTLPRGTSVDLTARAEFMLSFGRSFGFERWAVDCQGSEPETSIVLDRSKSCAAHFRTTAFDALLLTVINGGGRVTSSGGGSRLGPAAIDCGQTCSAIFPENTVVTLTAEDANGFEFTGWVRDCSGTARETSVVMTGPKTCEARFRPFELNVSVTGNGTVTSSPAGIDCGDQCAFAPRAGAVTLRALPALGWQLAEWGGDCTGTDVQTTLTMDADKSCTATFARIPGLFFLTTVVEGQGSVTSEPPGISCPPACVRLFPAGTVVGLTAHAASSFALSGWFDDCAAGAESTNQIIMNGDKQCRVRFAGAPEIVVAEFTYAPVAAVGRLITFDGSASHVFDPVTGTANPLGITSFAWDFDEDGTFEASGGRSSAAVAQYAFQTPGDHTVRLRVTGGAFDEVRNTLQVVDVQPAALPVFGLTVNKAGAGAGTVATDPPGVIRCDAGCTTAGPLLLESGTMLTLTARALPGSSFAGWSGPLCAGTDMSVQVTMTAAGSCTATFAASQPTLTVEVTAPPGSFGRIIAVEPTTSAISCGVSGGICSESFAPGTVVVLRPDSLSLELGRFTGWSSGCDAIGPPFACTVTMTSDRSVGATFSQ